MKKVLKFTIVGVGALYLGACAYFYFCQRQFLFNPDLVVTATPKEFGCAFEEVKISPNALSAYWIPGTSAKTLIMHHGNSGNIGHYAQRACRLNKIGFSVLVFDYRGFGKSAGEFPSESRIYEDAEAAWSFVTQNRNAIAGNVVLYGHSLGAAVAIEMGIRHPDAAAVIAESGFSSVYDMSILDPKFRFFPVSLLLNQRLDSINKVASLKMPVLFAHGEKDTDVPATMSEKLFAAALEPKKLLVIAGAGHDDVIAIGGSYYADALLAISAR